MAKKRIKKKTRKLKSSNLLLKTFLKKKLIKSSILVGILALIIVSGSILVLSSKTSSSTKTLAKISPTPTNYPSPTPSLEPTILPIIKVQTPTPLPAVNTLSTVKAKFTNEADQLFSAPDLQTIIKNSQGVTVYKNVSAPEWTINNLPPGRYTIEASNPSNYGSDTTNCQGSGCGSSMGGNCGYAFEAKAGDEITFSCRYAILSRLGKWLNEPNGTYDGPPEVDITYPSEGQTVNSSEGQFCYTDLPNKNTRGLERKYSINNGPWNSYGQYAPCFNPNEGQNKFEVQYKNYKFEGPVITRNFTFHKTQ